MLLHPKAAKKMTQNIRHTLPVHTIEVLMDAITYFSSLRTSSVTSFPPEILLVALHKVEVLAQPSNTATAVAPVNGFSVTSIRCKKEN